MRQIPALTTALMLLSAVLPGIVYAEEIIPAVFHSSLTDVSARQKKIEDVDMVLVTGSMGVQFWIGRYEVTQSLYESVMGNNPSYFKGGDLPVEQVSWFNAVEFCNRLSFRAGLSLYYNIDKKRNDPENRNSGTKWTVTVNSSSDGFRLPTSVEWESAARAGNSGLYFWGDRMNGDFCWYGGNSGDRTHAAGGKKPNGYGIFDICGNVREWCFEWHPLFPGLYRVIRDGHFSSDEEELQIEKTDYRAPHLEFGFTGIRLVKNI